MIWLFWMHGNLAPFNPDHMTGPPTLAIVRLFSAGSANNLFSEIEDLLAAVCVLAMGRGPRLGQRVHSR